MYIEISDGEILHVGFRDAEGVLVIDNGKESVGALVVTADQTDDEGRGGVIYRHDFSDDPLAARSELIAALPREEGIPRISDDMVPVSQLLREHEELVAISEMLRIAPNRTAVMVAYQRLRRHLGFLTDFVNDPA